MFLFSSITFSISFQRCLYSCLFSLKHFPLSLSLCLSVFLFLTLFLHSSLSHSLAFLTLTHFLLPLIKCHIRPMATFVKLSRLSAAPIADSTCPQRVSVWGHLFRFPFLTPSRSATHCKLALADRWKKVARTWHGTAAALCTVALYLPQLPLPPGSRLPGPWPQAPGPWPLSTLPSKPCSGECGAFVHVHYCG